MSNTLKSVSKINNFNTALLLVAIVFWFFADGVEFRSDSTGYFMDSVDILYTGILDYQRFPFRGPVFPLLSASVLYVADMSPYAVALIPRFAGALILLFGYLIVYQGRNSIPALSAVAALACTPLFIEMAATYHVDIVLTAFVFASLYFLIRSLEECRGHLLFVAGCLYGIAFLTKELVIVMLPLAFISIAVAKHGVAKLKGILLYYSGFLMVLLPWVIYLAYNGYGINLLVGRHLQQREASESKFEIMLDQFFESDGRRQDLLLQGGAKFVDWAVGMFGSGGSILLAVGFMVTLALALLTRRIQYVVLTLAPLSFSLFVIYWSMTVISDRQLTVFTCLLVLTIGPLVQQVVDASQHRGLAPRIGLRHS